jgi:hypothetical protein
VAALDPERHVLRNAGETIRNLPAPFSEVFDAESLDDVWIVPPEAQFGPAGINARSGIAFDEPLVVSIPGLDALQVRLGAAGDDTIFEFEISITPTVGLTIRDVGLSLRLSAGLFKPARLNPDTNKYEVDPDQAFVEIQLGTVTLSIDSEGGFEITTGAGITLPPTMIGDSGVVIEATGLQLVLNDAAAASLGLPVGTRGISITSATVHLPESLGRTQNLTMSNAFIGNGGFSGSLSAPLTPPVEEDFGGVPVTLEAVALTFVQNALVEASLTGTMVVPYFDKRVSVQLVIGIDGDLVIIVTGVAPGQGTYDPNTGIISLTNGPLTFHLDRLEIELVDGNAVFHAAGRVDPDVDGLDFPTFEVRDLSIDRHGNISVAGGWIDLPSQVSMSLYGFTLEITKIGFGTEEGPDGPRRWLGMSGGLKLVDGLQAGASVEGFRVLWDAAENVTLALDGVGIDLRIPEVLTIKGVVSLVGQEFRGGVEVVLEAIEFAIGGQFVAGTLEGTNKKYFAIFLHLELPVGIPLAATGLAIYGMAGLYANNMVPDKRANEGWYLNPDGGDGWYLREELPAITRGVENLAKWRGQDGGQGFGAGITLGTFPDNGYTFNGRLLLALSFPGPTIIIEGKANLFKKRSALSDEANFRALAVLEPGSTFLVALDAQYKFRSAGELLEIGGSAEAFFDFNRADAWHVWLGHRDNANRRIRARAFQLFNVDAYFMLDARSLEVGASWRYEKRYGFKHLSVRLGASLQGSAAVSWHPSHFSGSVGVEGRAELRAFGFGLGVSVRATVSGEVFEPLHLRGDFHVRIKLPWPLPDPSATVVLQWREPIPAGRRPALPLPLREAAVEIPARSLRWPFRRGTNLLPIYDQGDLEYEQGDPDPGAPFTFANSLVVPADSQVGLAFSRAIADPAQVGNHYVPVEAEVVGDPISGNSYDGSSRNRGYTVGYSLTSLVLEKVAPIASGETPGTPLPPGQAGIGWVVVAQKGGTPPAGVKPLFGAWTQAAPPQLPENQANRSGSTNAQTKLLVNARSPFEYTGRASHTWDEWFAGANPTYPCLPPEYGQNFVAVFTQPIGTFLGSSPDSFKFTAPAFEVEWNYGGDVTTNREVVNGILGPIDRGLRHHDERPPAGTPANDVHSWVIPPPGATDVQIRFGTPTVFRFTEDSIGTMSDDPLRPSEPAAMADVVAIAAFDSDGEPDPHPVGGTLGGRRGMIINDGQRVEFTPIVPALAVELRLYGGVVTPRARIQLFDSSGNPLLSPAQEIGGADIVLRYDFDDIAKVTITVVDDRFVLSRIVFRTPVTAVAFSASSPTTEIGRFVEDSQGLVHVQRNDLGKIYLFTPTGGDFLFLELSVAFRTDEIIRHTIESLDQFNSEGPVLEPETDYRLTVRTNRTADGRNDHTDPVNGTFDLTESVYFRTAALPGIGVPAAPEGTVTGDPAVQPRTGFEDLSYYVKRTVPAVPPPAGGHNSPARAVYRAYDPAVEFSEETTYVELMYRLGRRDLTLRLFEADSQPVRDGDGRVLIGGVVWGRGDAISSITQRWIGVVNAAACTTTPPFDDSNVVSNEDLTAPAEDMVLAPQALHQARLVPMLLHETFVDARAPLVADGVQFRLDRWHAVSLSIPDPLSWVVRSETVDLPGGGTAVLWYVTEETGRSTSLIYEGALASINDTTRPDHPSQWTDYRASVQIRWSALEVGLDVRHNPGGSIRVRLNRAPGADSMLVELLTIIGGVTSSLGSGNTTIPVAEDVTVVVECVGSRVEVFVHGVGQSGGAPLIATDTAPVFAGTVALFANNSSLPRFSDIRVHDLRDDAATAYQWDYITSSYINFHHHLHSFDDQAFDPPEDAGLTAAELAAQAGAAVSVPSTPGTAPGLGEVSPAEDRAFGILEEAALGPAALQTPERIEIVRASHDEAVNAVLIRSPEPLRWERTQIALAVTSTEVELGIPEDLKLSDVQFGVDASQERVTLLVRSATRLAGHRIESRPLPTTAEPDPPWVLHYEFAENETEIADGIQVQVFSSHVDDAPPRAPGTTQRFVAENPGEGELHFAAPGVELRLLAPTGAVLHQRQFLTAEAYTPVAAQAIRKLDGTALFLFVPSGTVIPGPPTSLRVSLTFSRNAGADLPILQQAGSEAPETAVLEFVLRD